MLRGKIGELAKRVKVGFVGTCEKYYTTDTRYPMIRTTNLSEYGINYEDLKYVTEEFFIKNKKSQLHDGDVLIARFGTSGTACVYHGGEAQCLNAIIVEPDIETTIPEYLAIAINSRGVREQVNRRIVGSTQAILNTKVLSDIEIELPTLSEQKKIVGVFESIHKLQLLQTKTLVELDALIKARFVEMFGNPESSEKYPKIAIKDFTDVVSGGTPDRKNNAYWDNGTVPWIKTTELQNNSITNVEEYITEKGLNESSAKIVPADTVLIAMYGQGKTRGMTAILEIPASTNQACACILPCKDVEPKYLWQYMIMSYDRLRNLAQGGNQPNLNGNVIKNFPVLVPPKNLQLKFVEFTEQVDKSKVAVQKSLDATQLLFESLMQKYFG